MSTPQTIRNARAFKAAQASYDDSYCDWWDEEDEGAEYANGEIASANSAMPDDDAEAYINGVSQ